MTVRSCAVPAGSLLDAYARAGAFADCYSADVPGAVSQREFVEAFYTSPVFKIERWLIAVFLSRPASDADAREMAAGSRATFAAWRVERHTPDQIVLATGNTRSWLMAAPGDAATRLYFGSAVVPRRAPGAGVARMGWPFRLLLGFHKLYSRVLLGAACRKLRNR